MLYSTYLTTNPQEFGRVVVPEVKVQRINAAQSTLRPDEIHEGCIPSYHPPLSQPSTNTHLLSPLPLLQSILMRPLSKSLCRQARAPSNVRPRPRRGRLIFLRHLRIRTEALAARVLKFMMQDWRSRQPLPQRRVAAWSASKLAAAADGEVGLLAFCDGRCGVFARGCGFLAEA